MTKLRISESLSLPLDLVTESVSILAIKRMGNSYTARKIADQLYGAGRQVVIVDTKGDWWGIRSAANGRDPGLPIVILGGEHGDVPLMGWIRRAGCQPGCTRACERSSGSFQSPEAPGLNLHDRLPKRSTAGKPRKSTGLR